MKSIKIFILVLLAAVFSLQAYKTAFSIDKKESKKNVTNTKLCACSTQDQQKNETGENAVSKEPALYLIRPLGI